MIEDRLYQARILVVDDEPVNVRILERLLAAAGYARVRPTTQPREGLELVEEWRPDLILLDLLMPEVDGYQFLEHLAERQVGGIRPPVVVLTADVTRQARKRALSLGAMDFLTKPFDHVEVLLRIGNLLQTHFLQLDLHDQNELLEERVRVRTRELRESLDRLRATTEQRQQLISRLVSAQEEERRRVAGDIHDDTIQTMVAVGIRLEMLRRRLADPEMVEELDRLALTTRDAIGRLRNLLFELRPAVLDRDGLSPALQLLLERMEAEGGPAFELRTELPTEPPGEVRTVLFRIAQEAITNVRKHARAHRLSVAVMRQDGGVLLRIADDGSGFEPERMPSALPGHLGLTAMQERAETAGGWCRLTSTPGQGTTVEVWIPVGNEQAWIPADDRQAAM